MPGYHKKKNKQKKAHHNGEPHDHPHKKKQKLKERLAKIGADNKRGDVDVDKNEQYKSVATNEYYNKHDADMGGYNKDILDKVQLKNQKKVKKGKKVPQKRRETPTKENNYQTHMDSKGAFEQRALKEKVKKAELTDVTDQQKKKRKDKEKLIHQARGTGVIPTYSKSKVKKTPPQGPSGGTAETPEAIIKDAEAVARKNDTYIGKLKEKIASKKKEQERRILKETEEEEEIRHQKISQEHDHSITFKGYKGESYKRASLISNTGKYAKYWLLNAKQTNGNGWGVSQQSIAKNIHKFVGKPLVVTAKSWIPDSEYGDAYEHPYLPTNDINKVFDHQEKFRVGSIVDIIEKDGDYFANIEINQKFAHMVMPPFCSPAIFQNNPSEPEGQISDWEALHLAALHEDPAYGSRIALLRGTCVGTQDQCTVQFKSAKQQAKMVCTKGLKKRLSHISKIDRIWGDKPKIPKDKANRDNMNRSRTNYEGEETEQLDDPKRKIPPTRMIEQDLRSVEPVSDFDMEMTEGKGYKYKPNKPQGWSEEYIKKNKLAKERLARIKKNEKTSDQAIDDVIKDIKDSDLREDAETRHHHTRPKRLYNYNKKAKLKQRIAAIEQQKLALKSKPSEVLKAFKNYRLPKTQKTDGLKSFDDTIKPLYTKNKAGTKGLLTDGKNLYYSGHINEKGKFVPHKIAEHTPKGIRVSNAGYDSKSTYKYLRQLGIHTNQVKGQRFINKKPYNAQAGRFVNVPYEDISDKPIVFNPGKSSGNRSIIKQRAFSEKARKRTTGDTKAIPESPTAIQPKDQRLINKITGIRGKIPSRRILGTETDHIFQRSKFPKMESLKYNSLPIDPPSHLEKHNPQSTIPKSFYSKLKQRIAAIKQAGRWSFTEDNPDDKIPAKDVDKKYGTRGTKQEIDEELQELTHMLSDKGLGVRQSPLEHDFEANIHNTDSKGRRIQDTESMQGPLRNKGMISYSNAVKWSKLKQRLSKISGMPKDNKWVYDSIDDPYMSTEIAEHRELEYPVIKWNKGEEYAVLSNKSGKPLQDNKFSTKNPPKNIEYLQQFNNPEDALDYSEYKHTKEYGSHLFENDEHFKGLEKKFKHIKDPNTQYQ